jgi:hypothetical protein
MAQFVLERMLRQGGMKCSFQSIYLISIMLGLMLSVQGASLDCTQLGNSNNDGEALGFVKAFIESVEDKESL